MNTPNLVSTATKARLSDNARTRQPFAGRFPKSGTAWLEIEHKLRQLKNLAVAECVKKKGWLPGLNTDPFAIQQDVTSVHLPIFNEYLTDLREAVTHVRNSKGTFNERTY